MIGFFVICSTKEQETTIPINLQTPFDEGLYSDSSISTIGPTSMSSSTIMTTMTTTTFETSFTTTSISNVENGLRRSLNLKQKLR